MHGTGKVFGRFQLALHKRFVDDPLRGHVRQFTLLPGFDLLSHVLKASLHSIDADRNAVDERERLRVFGKNRGKVAREMSPYSGTGGLGGASVPVKF
jgi:hypothetical protein